jgi:cytidine deaminase
MSQKEQSYDPKELYLRASEVARNAYVPYSQFRVGAAVGGQKGIYVGANVENASYGLAICAERVALALAIANGDREIYAIAVSCIDADPQRGLEEFVPCGACRQWISEIAPDADILICQKDKVFKIYELLPTPFRIKLHKTDAQQ